MPHAKSQSDYSLLAHYCWATFLNHDPQKCWILIVKEFAAYFDDGGHPDSDMLLIAGFLSSADQWLLFENEWRDALEQCSLPRETCFHMTDFMAGAKQFKGWSKNQKHRLLDKLVHIAAVRCRKHFSETVFMDNYRQVNDKYALQECHGAPYGLLGRNLNARLSHWLKAQGSDARLLIFFEDGSKHKGDLLDNCQRDGLPTPTFRKKCELIPLQAADMLAWIIGKNMEKARLAQEKNLKFDGDYYLDVLIRYGWQMGDDGAFGVKELTAICDGSEGFPIVPLRSEIGANYHIAHHSLPKKPRKRTIFLQPSEAAKNRD